MVIAVILVFTLFMGMSFRLGKAYGLQRAHDINEQVFAEMVEDEVIFREFQAALKPRPQA